MYDMAERYGIPAQVKTLIPQFVKVLQLVICPFT